MGVDTKKIIQSVFDVIEDRTTIRQTINSNLPLVAQNTINDVKTYWNTTNSSLEKNVVDKVVRYVEQQDDFDVYKTYARAIINDGFVVSKEIDNAVTEMYNWYKGNNFTERMAEMLTKTSKIAPAIRITEDRITVGSILDIQLGSNGNKRIPVIEGNGKGNVTLSNNVVVNYSSVNNGNTSLSDDISRLDRRIDILDDKIKSLKSDLNKVDDKVTDLVNELKYNKGEFAKFATKTELEATIEQHLDESHLPLEESQIAIRNELAEFRKQMNMFMNSTNSVTTNIKDLIGKLPTKEDYVRLSSRLDIHISDFDRLVSRDDDGNITSININYLPFNAGELMTQVNLNTKSIEANLGELRTHTNNADIHTNLIEKDNWNNKYTKPADGIPLSDLSIEVTSLLYAGLVKTYTATKQQINKIFIDKP